MPADLADELAKLQDQVPPFPSAQAVAMLEAAYGKPLSTVFKSFEETPVASASVAQVHFAVLPDGRDAAVKILRPGIASIIEHDLALLDICADLIERLWSEGRRLKPHEVVGEFEKYLRDELRPDARSLQRQQLKRNFANSPLLVVPEIYGFLQQRSDGGCNACTASRSARWTRCAKPASTSRDWRQTASKSSIRKFSATASSTPDMHRARAGRSRRPLHRTGLRHHGHADRQRQALPRTELHRLLPPRLQACRRGAHRIRLGARRHQSGRARRRDPLGVRTYLRQAAARGVVRPRAAAPVPGSRAASASKSSRSWCCCRRRC